MYQIESNLDGRQDDPILVREDTPQLLMIRQLIKQLAEYPKIGAMIFLKEKMNDHHYSMLSELINAHNEFTKHDDDPDEMLKYICECRQTSFGIDLDAFIDYLTQCLVELG